MTRPLRVLMGLTYYAPYVSGLTNAARDVAVGLVRRGHQVTVVTTRHDDDLPEREVLDGVVVLRAPVVARLGKGTVSPALPLWFARASRSADVVNLHLPMLEAGLLARLSAAPVVSTYQCDISLPPGAASTAQRVVMDASSRAAFRSSAAVGVSSLDYAEHSRVWAAMSDRAEAIAPPSHLRSGGSPRFRETGGLHVGFLGRIVEEKGVEYLVEGFRALEDPDARLLVGGSFSGIAGGSVVERVRRAVADDPRVRMLGFVADEDLADLYASLDVFALTSVNAFEAFGIVQVEAMLAGVPSLTTDLPGVRQPVLRTGFGAVVPPRDSAAVTAALRRLRAGEGVAADGRDRARALYGLEPTVDAYEGLLARAAARR